MSFTIDKNVPIPASTAGRGAIYPFAAMEPGDSFFVPATGEALKKRAASLSRAASMHAKKHEGRKYTTRKVPDEGGVRVWRTA